MGSKTTSSVTNSPPPQVLANYTYVTNTAKNVAATPYQPYTGELVSGLNQGQSDAIGQLQQNTGVANPYLNAGSTDLNNAAVGLDAAQPYLQLGSQAAAQGQRYQQQAAGLAGPDAYQQYMNPYTQSVINATMGNLNANDAVQQQQLTSNAIGQGAFGGDRAGIAANDLARQQDLANNQTVAGLQSQGYTQAVGQAQAAAGLYGNLANSANQSAQIYGGLGQTQGQIGSAYGALGAQAGNLGNIAQTTATQGASAALQGSTLQQQNQQAQDTAAYQQFQNAIQYPFQSTGWLANIDEGIGSNAGQTQSTNSSGLSQIVGAGETGLGILGQIGGSGGVAAGCNAVTGLLTSDARVKDDIAPIGKTFDGQTMYRFRYKGSPTVHTGLIAQEVEKRMPGAVHSGPDGVKALDYGTATARAAQRGHFAQGGPVPGLGGGTIDMQRGEGGTFVLPGLSEQPVERISRHLPYKRSLVEGMRLGAQHPELFPGVYQRDDNSSSRSGYAEGGLVLRPRYDDGGTIDPNAFGAPAALPTPGLNFSATGLTGGGQLGGISAPTPQTQARGQRPLGGLQHLEPSGSNPAPTSPSPSPGLGGAATASPMDGVASAGSDNRNLWLGLMAAGLSTLGGTSASAGTNIGQGGMAGLQFYQGLQNQDRQNAVSRAEVTAKLGGLDLERQKFGLEVLNQQRLINANRVGAGLPALDFGASGSGSGSVSTAPRSPAAGLGSAPAPVNSVSGLAGGAAAPSPTQDQPSVPALPAVAPLASTTAGSASSGASSSLAPDFDPQVLATRADAAQSYGDTAGADALRSRAAAIVSNGYGLDAGGNRVPLPGYFDNLGQQKTAETRGEEAGKTQNVYDPDGNPIAVPGSTYQAIVAKGGGVVNGVPVTGAQSAYMKPNVENYADFTKSALAFEKDYQPNVYSLNALAHIYQNYQGGRGSEAIADLAGYAKQAGIEELLPDNWQNSQAGFDAAYKSAVDQSFKQLADSGAQKAPATGLREALLTTARPDTDSAARFKIITDKLAALNYQHDMIGNIVNSGNTNVLRGMISFQNGSKYGDYVNAARSGDSAAGGDDRDLGQHGPGADGRISAGERCADAIARRSACGVCSRT